MRNSIVRDIPWSIKHPRQPTSVIPFIYRALAQGRIQDFHLGGGGANSLSAGVKGPLKGRGNSRVVLMLSRAIGALFLSNLKEKKKTVLKKQSRSNFRGAPVAPPPPPWIRHCWRKWWAMQEKEYLDD